MRRDTVVRRRTVILGLAAVGLAGSALAFAKADALPSWNDGTARKAILDFVAHTTTSGSAEAATVSPRPGGRRRRRGRK